jgi:hypothetical protein
MGFRPKRLKLSIMALISMTARRVKSPLPILALTHIYTNSDLCRHPAWDDLVGLRPPDEFRSNGVTCGPDILFGRDLRPAAHIHDFEYSIGGTEIDRYWADVDFRHNLKLCGLAGALAPMRWLMFFRLRLWGHFCFTYAAGANPNKLSPRFWWHLLIGRYVEW